MDDRKRTGIGNLGDENKGFQKLANDKAKSDVLREFAAEMDSHDRKRVPEGRSPLNSLSVPPKQDIKEEEPTPLDFDERMLKYLRD